MSNETLKYSELLNRLIMDRTSTEDLGRIEDLLMVPAAHRVIGFVYKSGFLANQKKLLSLEQLNTIGPDAVMIDGQSMPETAIVEESKHSETLIGHEVWTEGGTRIGKISDYLFDAKSGAISQYLFVASGLASLTDGTYTLDTPGIVTIGKKRLIVSESVAEQSALHSDGLRQKLTTAVGQAKEAFDHARESVKDKAQNLSEQAKGLLEQAKDKAQVLSEQAKDKAQTFTEQAKDKAQALSVQALEGAHDALENVQQKLDSKSAEETPTLLEAPVEPSSEVQ
jgi:uncharacterized protein YrrD